MPLAIESRSASAPSNGRKLRQADRGRIVGDYGQRLATVLEHAARIFCEKGYEGASMRDLSRATGMSLAGLYHYFESKEELLYLIQKHTFRTIIDNLRVRLEGSTDAEERIRVFVKNHVEYFLANKEAMRVLTHEDETLKNGRGTEVRAIKREYYRICLGLVEDFQQEQGLEFSGRLAVLSLFGMINWIYTWHNPRVDADAASLSRQMGDIFLHGILQTAKGDRKVLRAKPKMSSQHSAISTQPNHREVRRQAGKSDLPAARTRIKG